jgi:uncharacterized phage-associated protein
MNQKSEENTVQVLSVVQIADYFINKSKSNKLSINHTKIQKLCYISQGFTLALLNNFLFYEEIQAWKYGPVIPTLYEKLKNYKNQEITNPILPEPEEIKNTNITQILDFVFKRYSTFTAGQLTSLTHETDTPWYEVWNKEEWSTIPPQLIQNYYQSKYIESLKI